MNMDEDSPVVERRSRKIAPVINVVEDVPPEEFNDDEEERNRLRKQAESNIRNNSTAVEKRLSISEKSITEHFQSCIQLAAENKINAKNAFSFKLIDLMHMMLSKKKQIKDFTEVTSSLDAGVKIYSYRVDNVHSDTLKMATSISVASNKKKNDENVEGEQDADEIRKKKKLNRKTRKTTIATNLDQINQSKLIEQEEILPNILSNENFITTSAIFDSNRVCWHLNTSLNFWNSSDRIPQACDNVSIEVPNIPEDAVLCRTFNGFRFGEKSVSTEFPMKEKISNVFDYRPSAEYDELFGNDVPSMNDDIEIQHSDFEEPSKNVEYLSKIMSSSDFVSDISRLIQSEKSEYFYFNSQLLKRNWSSKNMRHWDPFKKKKGPEEKRSKVNKKELIDFNNFDNLDIYDKVSDVPLITSSVASREKFLITPITHFSINEFFRLKIWREMFVIPTSPENEDQPSDLEETINDYDYNNPNDSQHYIPERYEDDYCDDDDNDAVNDIHEAIEKNAFIGDNLVEIPNKISKIQLPYMVKDKSVNMKNLKLTIWKKLESSTEEAVEQNQQKSTNFSEVCKVILIGDKKHSDEELTVPILFNAILQLANDKSLYLFNPSENDLSDFMVTVPSSAN